MSKAWFSFFVILICFSFLEKQNLYGQNQDSTLIQTDSFPSKDSTSVQTKKKKRYEGIHQWRIGTDLARLGMNLFDNQKMGLEIQTDFKRTDKQYWTAELGWGRENIDYTKIKYHTNTAYLKLGLDQSLLSSMGRKDFDIVFMGFRYALGFGNRSEASFSFDSPFGGSYSGVAPGQSFFVHWGEVTLGMKLEIWKRIFLGWTVRGKFLFNPGVFKDIKPNYIAGYGSGDKATNFDANLYLSYALIRYQKK